MGFPRPFGITPLQSTSDPQSAKSFVNDFYPYISRPVEYASRFYTLYWLSEVKGRKELDPELMEMSSKLATAFRKYGVYSVARELTHLGPRSNLLIHLRAFAGQPYKARWRRGNYIQKRKAISLWVEKNLSPTLSGFSDKEYLGKIIYIFGFGGDELTKLAWPDKYVLTFISNITTKKLDTKFEGRAYPEGEDPPDILGNPEKFLQAARILFAGEFTGIEWEDAFGGNAWARVARTVKKGYELPDKIWVDTAWGLQHNFGVWLDKVAVDPGEKIKVRKISKTFEPRISPVVEDMLNKVLAAAREEDMKTIWKIAIYFDPKLKRYRSFIPAR